MLFLKRSFACFFALILIFSLISCGGNTMSATENALIAVQKLDFDTFVTCLTQEDGENMQQTKKLYEGLSASEKEVLVKLYGLFHYTVESEEENGNTKTVKVTVTSPDMQRIRVLAETRKIVSAKSAAKILLEMLTTGEVEKSLMTVTKLAVTEIKENGAYRIAYGEKDNKPLADLLYLTEIMRFFAAS